MASATCRPTSGVFSPGTSVYLSVPASDGAAAARVLHEGKVLESGDESLVAALLVPADVAVGADVTLFGDWRGKFLQQGATVAAVGRREAAAPAVFDPNVSAPTPEPAGAQVIAFRRVGEPAPAESRGSYRVSTANAGIVAQIGNHANCVVMDLSPEGLAAIVPAALKVGTIFPVTLSYEDQTLTGPVRLQTIKVLPNGKSRYGFLAFDKAGPMRRGLERLAAAVQRGQLRRLARSA